MTALKEIRAELGALVGAKLGVIAPDLGANVNPPCVIVQPATPYLEPSTYDSERVHYEVLVVAGPGSNQAQLDALDDLLDEVRGSLRKASTKGLRFAFTQADPSSLITIGQTDHLAASVHVTHERECD